MSEPTQTQTLVIERVMAHSAEKIWRALTQPALVAEWLMKNDFQATVGHQFKFRSTPMPQWDGIINCRVLVVEPARKLSYSWGSMGLETVVVWTLSATQGGTLVRMEQSGFGPGREANYKGAQYGWKGFIDALERTCAKIDP